MNSAYIAFYSLMLISFVAFSGSSTVPKKTYLLNDDSIKDSAIWNSMGLLVHELKEDVVGVSGIVVQGWSCSAVALAPQIVVTAAHCLYQEICDEKRNVVSVRRSEDYVGFFVHQVSNSGYKEKIKFKIFGKGNYAVCPDLRKPNVHEAMVQNDWAVLELEKPFENLMLPAIYPMVGKLPIQSAIFLAGYPGTAGIEPIWSYDCKILSQKSGAFFSHNCYSSPGSSGGGLFFLDPSGTPFLIGLASTYSPLNNMLEIVTKGQITGINHAVSSEAFLGAVEKLKKKMAKQE